MRAEIIGLAVVIALTGGLVLVDRHLANRIVTRRLSASLFRVLSDAVRSRSAFAITDTELRVIAALAQIGLISTPKQRIQHAGRDRHAEHVVDERQKQVLPDVPHRRRG